MRPRSLACAEAEETRLGLAAGPVDEALAQALAAHLAGCAPCRRFAADIDRIERGLGEALSDAAGRGSGAGAGERFLAALEPRASPASSEQASEACPEPRRRDSDRRSTRRSGSGRAGSGRRRVLIAARALAACLVVAAAAFLALRQDRPEARALVRSGQAEVERGGGARQRIAAGAVLAAGDRLFAGGAMDAEVVLSLPGGAEVALAPRSRASLEELAPRRAMRLLTGRAHCVVEPGHGAFEVETVFATASVVGTDFTVELLHAGGRRTMATHPRVLAGGAAVAVAVGVVAGAVLLRTPDGDERVVGAGQVGVAGADGRIEVHDAVELEKETRAATARAAELEAALARSETRAKGLEARVKALEAAGPADARAAGAPAKSPPAGDAAAAATGEPGAGEATPPASGSDADKARKLEELVKKVDWPSATAAIVEYLRAAKAGKAHAVDPRTIMMLSRLNVAVGEIAELLGLDDLEKVYEHPAVMDVFVPAWLDACGAGLDPDQVERLRAAVRTMQEREGQAGAEPAAQRTFLERVRQSVRSEVEFDEYLPTLLRPDQYGRYHETVGEDPYFGSEHPTERLVHSSADGLADLVAGRWLQTFRLGEVARPHARAVAYRFVMASLAVPPVDPTLDPSARRLASLRRADALLGLQIQAEHELARDLPLTQEERDRVAAGVGYLLEVSLSQ